MRPRDRPAIHPTTTVRRPCAARPRLLWMAATAAPPPIAPPEVRNVALRRLVREWHRLARVRGGCRGCWWLPGTPGGVR